MAEASPQETQPQLVASAGLSARSPSQVAAVAQRALQRLALVVLVPQGVSGLAARVAAAEAQESLVPVALEGTVAPQVGALAEVVEAPPRVVLVVLGGSVKHGCGTREND